MMAGPRAIWWLQSVFTQTGFEWREKGLSGEFAGLLLILEFDLQLNKHVGPDAMESLGPRLVMSPKQNSDGQHGIPSRGSHPPGRPERPQKVLWISDDGILHNCVSSVNRHPRRKPRISGNQLCGGEVQSFGQTGQSGQERDFLPGFDVRDVRGVYPHFLGKGLLRETEGFTAAPDILAESFVQLGRLHVKDHASILHWRVKGIKRGAAALSRTHSGPPGPYEVGEPPLPQKRTPSNWRKSLYRKCRRRDSDPHELYAH